MSDTPLTDAIATVDNEFGKGVLTVVPIDFARTLERSLSDARQRCDFLERELSAHKVDEALGLTHKMLDAAAEKQRELLQRAEQSSRREREGVADWSFLRKVLEQGAAIQQDYAAGKYANYEEYSARIDEAARERDDALRTRALRAGVWVPVEPTYEMMWALAGEPLILAASEFLQLQVRYKAMLKAASPEGDDRRDDE